MNETMKDIIGLFNSTNDYILFDIIIICIYDNHYTFIINISNANYYIISLMPIIKLEQLLYKTANSADMTDNIILFIVSLFICQYVKFDF